MRTLLVLSAIVLAAAMLSASTPPAPSTVDWSKAERHYKANLLSENAGVVASAAGFIRKYNLSGASEELKALLSAEQSENVRMSAALTLLKTGGAEGRAAVEEALKSEESELVSEFYRSMLHMVVSAGN